MTDSRGLQHPILVKGGDSAMSRTKGKTERADGQEGDALENSAVCHHAELMGS